MTFLKYLSDNILEHAEVKLTIKKSKGELTMYVTLVNDVLKKLGTQNFTITGTSESIDNDIEKLFGSLPATIVSAEETIKAFEQKIKDATAKKTEEKKDTPAAKPGSKAPAGKKPEKPAAKPEPPRTDMFDENAGPGEEVQEAEVVEEPVVSNAAEEQPQAATPEPVAEVAAPVAEVPAPAPEPAVAPEPVAEPAPAAGGESNAMDLF